MADKQYLDFTGLSSYDGKIKAHIESALSVKSDNTHNHDDAYDEKGAASTALSEAKSYADDVKNSLLNGAGTAYDTLLELGNLIDDNTDAIEALETVASGKADASHIHTVADVSDLTVTATELNYMDGVTSNVQTQLDGKAETVHIHPYGLCSTSGSTAEKTVTVDNFSLVTGAKVTIKFVEDNTAYPITLNVNGTGAKTVNYKGSQIPSDCITQSKVFDFVYDGTYWCFVGDSTHGFMTTTNPTGSGIISINRKADTTAGVKSVAMGNSPTASAQGSVALGGFTVASAKYSFASGYGTTASGEYSVAMNKGVTASGLYSAAFNGGTTASGDWSFASGYSTTASGIASHSIGYMTSASGDYSTCEGYNTQAASECQHVQGRYNVVDSDSTYLHIVGNGSITDGSLVRSNAHTLDWDGNAWYAGDVVATDTNGNSVSVVELLARIEELESQLGDVSAVLDEINGEVV